MLTAFHAKCRGSRRLQSVERPWLDSQTRHTRTRIRYVSTIYAQRRANSGLRAYIYALDFGDEREKPFPVFDTAVTGS